jgi:hypothetical protein
MVSEETFATVEADIASWRWKAAQARHFGMKQPALAPMDGAAAEDAARKARDLYWTGALSKVEYASELAAIAAARHSRKKAVPNQELRRMLLARDGLNCWLCGDELGGDCTIEHRVPKSRGGSSAFANLALAHQSCNRLMGDAPAHIKDMAREQRAAKWNRAVELAERHKGNV